MSLRKQSYFYRWVALLFVFLVLADILFSPPNSEQLELLGIPLINVGASDAGPVHQGPPCMLAFDSRKEQPQQSELPDDDSLSWCPHVLTSFPFSVAVQSLTSVTTNQKEAFLPTPPLESTFHPPRFV